jgi:tRNA (guanosine-2'-O-)-methyltransferase
VAVELAAGAIPLHRADVGGDVCLAVGNEDRGCSAALLAAAGQIAYIPQVGRVGSLNVAAAAAIAIAEARRREWAGLDGAPASDGAAGHETIADDEAPAGHGGADHGRPDDRGARR